MNISFFVPGDPKAQPRPKAFARRFGDKWHARVYDPHTAESWKSQIAIAAKDFVPFPALLGPICLTLEFYMPRPKSHFRSNGDPKESAPCCHIGKPDLDNLDKAVMDCLTQLGFWADDSQVFRKRSTKWYAVGRATGCRIVVEPVGAPEKERLFSSDSGENAALTTHR